MSAVSCRFLQVTYGDIDKKVKGVSMAITTMVASENCENMWCIYRLKSNLMFLMIKFVMNVRVCTAVGAMPPTSVATSIAFATTVSIAGLPSTLPQALRTTAASSKKMVTVHVPSISFPRSPE